QCSRGLAKEVRTVGSGICAVRETPSALIHGDCGSLPEAACGARRGRVTPTLARAGSGLVPFGGPRVYEASIVQTVNHQAGSITKHHSSFPNRNVESSEKKDVGGELRTSEPLIGGRRPLIARSFHRRVAHNRVDFMRVCQWAVELNAAAKRLDGLVA